MKKLVIVICTSVVLIAAFGSNAKAVTVNPANWTWTLETSGSPDSWTSDSNVPADFPQYDYDWQLTQADVLVDLLGWLSILDLIPDADKSKSATEDHLAFDIFGLTSPLEINLNGIIAANIYFGVGVDGYGQGRIDTVSLGQYGGFDVTAAEFGGNLDVTALPEPATVCLLGLGSLLLIRRSRR